MDGVRVQPGHGEDVYSFHNAPGKALPGKHFCYIGTDGDVHYVTENKREKGKWVDAVIPFMAKPTRISLSRAAEDGSPIVAAILPNGAVQIASLAPPFKWFFDAAGEGATTTESLAVAAFRGHVFTAFHSKGAQGKSELVITETADVKWHVTARIEGGADPSFLVGEDSELRCSFKRNGVLTVARLELYPELSGA